MKQILFSSVYLPPNKPTYQQNVKNSYEVVQEFYSLCDRPKMLGWLWQLLEFQRENVQKQYWILQLQIQQN